MSASHDHIRPAQKFNWLCKAFTVWLTAGFLGLGLPARAAGAKDDPKSPGPESALKLSICPGQAKLLTPGQLFDSYIRQGVEYARKKGEEEKAAKTFTKAVEVDRKKALVFDPNTLGKDTGKLYTRSLQQVLAKEFVEKLKEESQKGEKSWLSKNWYWVVPLGIAALAGIEYTAGDPLHIFKKEKSTPPPESKDVTITLDAYNHTKGFQKDLDAKTVKAGSKVDIQISDTGVTGVDAKYVAVYSEDFKKKISFDSDGEANFTAPSANVKYHVILFDALGTNVYGDQGSYDWVSSASLQNSKRNHIVYRKDYDGQTMEERAWGGESLPEIGGKKGVFDQINDALVTNYTTWGHVDRQPTATTGDFSYGAGNSEGADGFHYGDHITVNAKKLTYDMISMVATGDEEGFENLLNIDNIGGHPSRGTIQYQGVLNDNGKRLLLFAYIKDSASFTSSSTGAAAMKSAINTLNINQKFGPVEIGMNSGNLHAGFKNEKVGLNTNFMMNGSEIENYTTANFTGEKFQAGIGMTLSPNQKAYTAQSTLTIDKVVLGVSGGYDANSKIGNIAANIGAKVGNGNVIVGIAGTPGMFGFNVQATQALKNIGVFGFRGMYTKNQLADFTALGLDAQLNQTPIGEIRIRGDYSKTGMYKTASLGIGKPIGPGVFGLSLGSMAGKALAPEVRYSCSWSF
jgi:hypothetical protein